MPSRLACVAILLAWVGSAVALVRRDLVPNWSAGPPPDLRRVADDPEDRPIRWTILTSDGSGPSSFRPIGRVESRTIRRGDDSVRWTSEAVFEPSGLVRGKAGAGASRSDSAPAPEVEPIRATSAEQSLRVRSVADIDPQGNLIAFRAGLSAEGTSDELITIEGRVEHNELDVQVRTTLPIPLLNVRKSFPYQPRGLIDNPLSPMDRVPGLRPGQRWESRMLHPLTGQAQEVKAEVIDDEVIVWGSGPVRCRVILTRVPPLSFRTWVRPDDGLVLRQEVPYPLTRLLLERQPDPSEISR